MQLSGGSAWSVQSENTLSSAAYLCALQCVIGVFACWGDGEKDEWGCAGVSVLPGTGTGAFRDWTLSSGVNRRASRNAAALSVLKELETPERKANVSVGRPRWVLWDIFLALLCSSWQI